MMLAPYRLALQVIALRVPAAQRVEWLAEWMSELWYVSEAAAEQPGLFARHKDTAVFCRGAIDDAVYLREQHSESPVRASGSAVTCLVMLSVIALAALGLSQLLPGVQQAMRMPSYRTPSNVVRISSSSAEATVPLGAARSLMRRPQHLFADLAFYQPVMRPLHLSAHHAASFTVGRASPNLLSLLGIPVWFAEASLRNDEPLLILSHVAWMTYFAASPAVFGAELKLGLQTVRLGGVIPDDAAPAGQHFDGWLLMPAGLSSRPGEATGVHLLGRIAPNADAAIMHQQVWQMSVPAAAGQELPTDYLCTALAPPCVEAFQIFLFTLFLAVLALPATTSLSLGDYAVRPSSLPWTTALRRWAFLVAKLALSLPAIYFVSLDLCYATSWSSATTPEYLQLVLSFSAILFVLRWALRDQRRRCPVCLGKLSCPARVGQPSRNFLAWNGTELICVGGHGLLHVPELPTSWCGTQRWLHLDPSWSSLFFGPA